MAIRFFYADIKLPLKDKRKLKLFIASIFTAENKAMHEIHYVFCSDAYLLHINQTFLNHNDYTDIITFDLSEKGSLAITAEIYISVERVQENAVSQNQSFADEVYRVIFHGVLHLCGYLDKKKSEIALMRKTEDHYLRLWKTYEA